MTQHIALLVARAAARMVSLLGPGGMRAIARLNKHIGNPIQRLWAPYLPYYALILHTGRKSGRTYRTPVMAFVQDGELVVMLNYGTESDWVRNIQAARTANVVHRGDRYRLADPRVLPADSPELPAKVRAAGTPGRSVLHGTLTPTPPS
ncbi:nitroreductase family deazaflavin-dependent oxidoreductase [Actinocorallia longicatena]|uniref:Deazaflavin-dependent oxidoreductase (Nitroreductase family) n=1 Tax=Actinocorallia longicatena TaxID=111803 RepID=A0ABP6QB68_9ACTN